MIAELISNINAMSDVLDKAAVSAEPLPDAKTLAEMFAEQIPDESLDKIGALLDRPDLYAYMSRVAPRIKNHEAWWREFFTGLGEQFTSEPETAPAGVPPVA